MNAASAPDQDRRGPAGPEDGRAQPGAAGVLVWWAAIVLLAVLLVGALRLAMPVPLGATVLGVAVGAAGTGPPLGRGAGVVLGAVAAWGLEALRALLAPGSEAAALAAPLGLAAVGLAAAGVSQRRVPVWAVLAGGALTLLTTTAPTAPGRPPPAGDVLLPLVGVTTGVLAVQVAAVGLALLGRPAPQSAQGAP